jgi:hypothetical protein
LHREVTEVVTNQNDRGETPDVGWNLIGLRHSLRDSVLRSVRSGWLRRASVRDFHSLTWVTLALTAGVPLAIVQRVIGHRTTDVVLKHYFRPGQEDFRAALEGAMPKSMNTSAGSALALPAAPRDELRQAVDCAGTWLLYAPLPELIWGRALQWRSSLGLRQTTRGSKTARKAGLTILQKELAT